jgi:hypothetical protein
VLRSGKRKIDPDPELGIKTLVGCPARFFLCPDTSTAKKRPHTSPFKAVSIIGWYGNMHRKQGDCWLVSLVLRIYALVWVHGRALADRVNKDVVEGGRWARNHLTNRKAFGEIWMPRSIDNLFFRSSGHGSQLLPV